MAKPMFATSSSVFDPPPGGHLCQRRHEPPLLLRVGSRQPISRPPASAVGALPDSLYKTESITLNRDTASSRTRTGSLMPMTARVGFLKQIISLVLQDGAARPGPVDSVVGALKA
jgi:hypothetical protein